MGSTGLGDFRKDSGLGRKVVHGSVDGGNWVPPTGDLGGMLDRGS